MMGWRLAEILSGCPWGTLEEKAVHGQIIFPCRNQSVRSGVRFQKRRQEAIFALSGTCRNHVE